MKRTTAKSTTEALLLEGAANENSEERFDLNARIRETLELSAEHLGRKSPARFYRNFGSVPLLPKTADRNESVLNSALEAMLAHSVRCIGCNLGVVVVSTDIDQDSSRVYIEVFDTGETARDERLKALGHDNALIQLAVGHHRAALEISEARRLHALSDPQTAIGRERWHIGFATRFLFPTEAAVSGSFSKLDRN